MRIYKPFLFAFVLLFATAIWWKSSVAQEKRLSFKVNAPDQVETERAFQVVFEINREVDNFEGPDFSGFEVLGGPGYSESRYTSVVNGKRVSEISITYTYALKARIAGRYNVGSAQVRVGRETFRTAPFSITVSGQAAPEEKQTVQPEGGGDLFIQTYVSKKNPYKGEVVILTHKLYTRLAINNIGKVKLPAFNGFWSESVDIGNYEIVQENYQGRLYNTLILNRSILIPQRTGRITIDPSSVVIQRVVERTVDRRLWGGVIQQRVRELVENEIQGSSIIIDVKDLPSAGQPASFKGSVGTFSLEAQPASDKAEIGEPIEIRVRVSGSGNIKLLDEPMLILPDRLDLFDPEITTKVNVTASGMSGHKDYRYLIIPRDTGEFIIPGIEFSFFDPASRRYIQRVTDKLVFYASAGEKGSGYNTANIFKEDVKYLGKDIRYINPNLRKTTVALSKPGSWLHIAAIATPSGILLLVLILYRKQVRTRADLQKMRSLKALHNARNRLKYSSKVMREGDEKLFFELLLESLWSYAADKLYLQPALLNRARVKSGLAEKGANEKTIEKYIALIENCEFSRYAPAVTDIHMESLLLSAEVLIHELDSQIG